MLTALTAYLRRHHVALLALFVAVGGTSYAAVQVTGADIKDGTVTTADVKNKSLLAKDFKKGQLPAGPQGPVGARGPAGVVTAYQRTFINLTFPPSNNFTAQSSQELPPGKYAMTAVIRAENNTSATGAHVRCFVAVTGGGDSQTIGTDQGAYIPPRDSDAVAGSYYAQASMVFAGTVTIASGEQITPYCKRQTSETSAVTFGKMDLVAIPVAAIG